MRRILVSLLLVFTLSFSLAGCGLFNTGVSDVPAMTLAEVETSRLVALGVETVEDSILNNLHSRLVLGEENLIDISRGDRQKINRKLSNINRLLEGSKGDSLSEEFANYLLLLFTATPYLWVQSRVDFVGFDPATRFFFVDVTYTTTSYLKEVVLDSKIPKGSPNYETLLLQRRNAYISYLESLPTLEPEEAQEHLEKFEAVWGNVEDILKRQQKLTLLERVNQRDNAKGLGLVTYSGKLRQSLLNTGGVKVLRFVFKEGFDLIGQQARDFEVEALYLKSFELNDKEAILKSFGGTKDSMKSVLWPFLDRVINSYHRAVSTFDYEGLYGLYVNFSSIDKYYIALEEFTHNYYGAYTFRVLGVSGRQVFVQVDRLTRRRAKGAEMSLPTYNEVALFTFSLVDDDILVDSVTTISKEIVGEPLSVINNVSGVSDIIQHAAIAFTEDNREAVKNRLKDFSTLVFEQNIAGEEFLNSVELGLTSDTLREMVQTIKSIRSDAKTTYLVSWDTTTNMFVSVTIRELFHLPEGTFDTLAAVCLAKRGGEWRVVNYRRFKSVMTDKKVIETGAALIKHSR